MQQERPTKFWNFWESTFLLIVESVNFKFYIVYINYTEWSFWEKKIPGHKNIRFDKPSFLLEIFVAFLDFLTLFQITDHFTAKRHGREMKRASLSGGGGTAEIRLRSDYGLKGWKNYKNVFLIFKCIRCAKGWQEVILKYFFYLRKVVRRWNKIWVNQ